MPGYHPLEILVKLVCSLGMRFFVNFPSNFNLKHMDSKYYSAPADWSDRVPAVTNNLKSQWPNTIKVYLLLIRSPMWMSLWGWLSWKLSSQQWLRDPGVFHTVALPLVFPGSFWHHLADTEEEETMGKTLRSLTNSVIPSTGEGEIAHGY